MAEPEIIVHEGVEYTPFVGIYRRADATSGTYTGRKSNHFIALYTDPDTPYGELSGVASEEHIALALLQDAQVSDIYTSITGRNGKQESDGGGKDPVNGEAGTG